MSYETTLQHIHNVKWQGSKPGLERTQALLKALGNPEKRLKFVHIAGTNGKGSTAACIASVLERAGYRTGLYTSPYILRFNERMQVNGVHITDEELETLADEIWPHADTMTDPPTEFEIITALAMRFFVYKACDIVVLEVGMGGELDSTNVIDTPEVVVITSIGLDHTSELGSTLAEIAGAKAGIIKPGGTVAVYGGPAEVMEVFAAKCAATGSRLVPADFERLTVRGFDLAASHIRFDGYGEIALPLVGSYQPYNAALAITALECLREKGYRIHDEDITQGLARVRWLGRFEVLHQNPAFILDGAHNPPGILATVESLRLHFGDQKIVFLVGVMADKDVGSIAAQLAPLARCFVAVAPPNPRAMPAAQLAELLAASGHPAYAAESIEDGVSRAFAEAGEGGVICALGSLYFSGDVRTAVQNRK